MKQNDLSILGLSAIIALNKQFQTLIIHKLKINSYTNILFFLSREWALCIGGIFRFLGSIFRKRTDDSRA